MLCVLRKVDGSESALRFAQPCQRIIVPQPRRLTFSDMVRELQGEQIERPPDRVFKLVEVTEHAWLYVEQTS